MQYYIYKTINIINNNFYVGKRCYRKNDLIENDPYLGSGKLLKIAIQKYGKKNFYKQILDISHSEKENSFKEAFIVTKELIKNPKCYNMHIGGAGGFDHINSLETSKRPNLIAIKNNTKLGKYKERSSCQEYRQKISNSLKNNPKLYTNKNKILINNGLIQKYIPNCESIPHGYTKGALLCKIHRLYKEQNPMYNKRWYINIDAKHISEKMLYKIGLQPNNYILLKEWKNRLHKTINKHWYHDDKTNYFLSLEDSIKLNLSEGRKMKFS